MMDVNLIVFIINSLSPDCASLLTSGVNWLAHNYLQLLGVVRWLVPCVILSCLLICLSVPDNKEME